MIIIYSQLPKSYISWLPNTFRTKMTQTDRKHTDRTYDTPVGLASAKVKRIAVPKC